MFIINYYIFFTEKINIKKFQLFVITKMLNLAPQNASKHVISRSKISPFCTLHIYYHPVGERMSCGRG